MFPSWRPKPPNVGTSSPKISGLEKLPVELLYGIADFLAAPDRCCLSLCSHRLFNILGHNSRLEPKTEHWRIFLQRLSRDLPRHIYCHACSVIHQCEHIKPPGPIWYWHLRLPKHDELDKSPWLFWSVNVHPGGSRYAFFHIHVQLAMKRHYCGPTHGISTESLAYVEVQTSASPSLTSLLSVDAQICHGPRLCLRVQNWVLLKDFKPSSLYRIGICVHLNTQDAPIAELIQSESDTRKGSSRKSSNPNIYQCRACGIDYQMETIDCDREGTALVITKWLDLGSGLDPKDSRWTRHFYPLGTRSLGKIEAIQSDGTLCSHFEQESAVSLDALTHMNASLLERNAFLRKTHQIKCNTWLLQGDEAMAEYRR